MIAKQTLHHPDTIPEKICAGNQSTGEQEIAKRLKQIKTKILYPSGKVG